MSRSIENRAVKQAVRWALACGLTAGVTFGASAMAAEQGQAVPANPAPQTNATPTQLKAVKVTGTMIKRTSVEQAQPIQVINAAQIKASGLTSIGQVLQSITSSGSALNTQFDLGGNFQYTGGGQTNVNLRYLGAKRTLVLVNGHRWATNINGAVDLNTIPASIIDHVEILQDGASAIYGSDAVAGVVNIITIKNFQGGEADAYTGMHNGSGHWDGLNQTASLTMGIGNDHGNLVFGASYDDQKIIGSGDRAMTSIPFVNTGTTRFISDTPQGRYLFFPPDTGPTSSPNNAPLPSTGLTAAECPAQNEGTTAQPDYVPFCFLTTTKGKPGTSPADFHAYNQATDGFNYAPSELILSPATRAGLYIHGSLALNDNLTLQVTGAATRRNDLQHAAPSPVGVGSSSNVTFNPGDAFYPFNFPLSTQVPLGPGFLEDFGKRVAEAGPRIFTETENVSYLNAELDGFFDAGGSEWDWDIGGAYSRDDEANQNIGLFDTARLEIQFNPQQCQAVATTEGCTPINFFGGQTVPMTEAQYSFAQYTGNVLFGTNMNNVYADITNSDIGSLPGGPIGFATGYQHLNNEAYFSPEAIDTQGATIVGGVKPLATAGSNWSNAVYAEFDLPFLSNVPFAKLIDLDVATRYTQTGAAGITNHNTSSRAGLKWQPSAEWLIRASWSQGFRAPNISELFSGLSGLGIFGNDPCSNYTQSGVSADIQQRCQAAGVPPGYKQTLPQLTSQEFGNAHLKPETSISKTVGFVYSPDWLPGFNMNADYYDISVNNAIQPEQGQTILDNCYLQGIASDCSKIVRTQTGDIKQVLDPVTNIGGDLTSGADIGFDYALPTTPIGQFEIGIQGTWIRSYKELYPNPGSNGFTVTQLVGAERGGTVFPFGMPRWKVNGHVNWTKGPWDIKWNWYYISGLREACSDFLDGTPLSFTNLGLCSDPDTQNNGLSRDYMGRTFYHDLQFGYDYSPWNTTFTFGIKNIFNKNPPPCYSCELNSYDPTNYRMPGRFFYASVGVKF